MPENGTASAARSVVLGTAGHIDHGKTALVLALTGTDTDRLPEEKARGITIDLGFASLAVKYAEGQAFDLSLIDVPGHHAFIRNMLAGAGGIDAVMLVVAADEGVRAQTREHLQICRLLGISQGLVVLTKRDAVTPERLAVARGEVAALVQGGFLEGAPVLAVSALTREGIAELKAELACLSASVARRPADRVARLPIDRVFSVKGFGTVVTGTLQAGSVCAGQSLLLQPGQRSIRVRTLQVHGANRAVALAPNRVALNLPGIEVADVTRGDVAVPEGTLEPVTVVDVSVELLPGVSELRHRQRVRLHAFASECLATVLLYPGAEPGNEDGRMARLRLTKPMLLVPGDRFVIRLPSPAVTLGGGRVLDAYPLPRVRKAASQAWLETLRSAASAADWILLFLRRRGAQGISLRQLVRETGWTAAALGTATAALVGRGSAVAHSVGEVFVAAEALGALQTKVLREVEAAGAIGLSQSVVRSRSGAADWVFQLSVSRLQDARRLVLQGDTLRRLESKLAATGERPQQDRTARVEALYRTSGLASPLVSEVAERLGMRPEELRLQITTLLRAGKLVRLGSDALLVHGEALAALTAKLREKRGHPLDVSAFKLLTGLTRKHAIPLLEYLDGARVTRNVQGVRLVL